MKIVLYKLRPLHRDRIRKMSIAASDPGRIRAPRRRVEMNDLGQCVDASIGSARAMHPNGMARHSGQRRFQVILHGASGRLRLPSLEGGTIVLEAEDDSHCTAAAKPISRAANVATAIASCQPSP